MDLLWRWMEQDLALARRAPFTTRVYLSSARAFAAFHGRHPGDMGQAEVRAWVDHLRGIPMSPQRFRQHLSGLAFLYRKTLGRPEVVSFFAWPAIPRKLPAVLDLKEVAALLEAVPHPTYRMLFRTMVATRLAAAFGGDWAGQAEEQAGRGGRDRARAGRAEQEAMGRDLIDEVLREHSADVAAAGEQAWTPVQRAATAQAVFDAVFRLGRLQPLVDDDRVENIFILGHAQVLLELTDGTRIPGARVADSDEELIDFLRFLANRSESNPPGRGDPSAPPQGRRPPGMDRPGRREPGLREPAGCCYPRRVERHRRWADGRR